MPKSRSAQSPAPPVYVRVQQGTTWSDERRFTGTFRIGRDQECELSVAERAVSKVHAEVRCEEGQWWIVDLQSRNGTYLDGERIERASMPSSCKVELGQGGPILWISVGRQIQDPESPSDKTSVQKEQESVTEIVERLEGRRDTGDVGDKTERYDKALERIAKRRSRRYQVVLGIVVLLLLGAVSVAIYQYQKIEALRATAGDIFYAMKRVELQVAQLEELVEDKKRTEEMQDILSKRQEIKNLESKYDQFVKELGLYDSNMSEQDRAVFRVARLFGECEATMPKEFLAEVNRYITRWKSTDRLTNAHISMDIRGPFPARCLTETFHHIFSISRFKKVGLTPRQSDRRHAWGMRKACGNSFPQRPRTLVSRRVRSSIWLSTIPTMNGSISPRRPLRQRGISNGSI
jgi:membrane-bound lytic murein transglycosylase D